MIQSGLDLQLLLEAFELLDERLLPGRDPTYRQVIERRFERKPSINPIFFLMFRSKKMFPLEVIHGNFASSA